MKHLFYQRPFKKLCCLALLILCHAGLAHGQALEQDTTAQEQPNKPVANKGITLDTLQMLAIRWDARVVKNNKASKLEVKFDSDGIDFNHKKKGSVIILWKHVADISYRQGLIYVVGKKDKDNPYQREVMVLQDASRQEQDEFVKLLKNYKPTP